MKQRTTYIDPKWIIKYGAWINFGSVFSLNMKVDVNGSVSWKCDDQLPPGIFVVEHLVFTLQS